MSFTSLPPAGLARGHETEKENFLRRNIRAVGSSAIAFFEEFGRISSLGLRTLREAMLLRFEWRAVIVQVERLGLRSFAIAAATAVFVGVVMAIQFAFSLERFGARDSVGRIVGLSEARELAPSLTSLVVGSRVGAGIAAEIGSMVVTEQVDAIRALGADPLRKLVLPRVLAGMFVMPVLATFALMLGTVSAALVCYGSFGIPIPFFISSAIDAVLLSDFLSGLGKTPFFGFLVTLLGCHYGLATQGGTEGVGKSTTTAVVGASVAVLVADAVLTQLFLVFLRNSQ